MNLWGSENDDWNKFICAYGTVLKASVGNKSRLNLVHLEESSNDPEDWLIRARGSELRISVCTEKGE